ncbi:SAM-dependent methyltransferase [Actinokineospora globicatena]|uniref:SAM-dependent methyltransferase n=1 Tax=Actinokineospora globicatena TaxID=103729 RepID=UPI0020A2A7ED|nr:class I SAM-dependent methyltransferase [Actinokineospora globicatena]MCP2304637.1 Methyltransferase domain-containing protein [Actinokineospora globicatena]GLW77991.1 methyltransferase [Actinokineospora globicatena]GLW85343.1 methyltransferase [Actinokineospora globicatena]
MTETHAHRHATETAAVPAAEFWETFYSERDQIWSGKPNDLLVREASDLPPGTVLDLGCAEGGDAVWLAERGWKVTGVDVSTTALARAAQLAAERGVTDAITFERHDLATSFPEGRFDLVSAQYFHSPVEQAGEREQALRQAAGAVAPGGVLLVVGHFGWPTWMAEPKHDYHFPTTDQVLASLRLDDRWVVELQDVVHRPSTSPEGVEGTRSDNVLRVRLTA